MSVLVIFSVLCIFCLMLVCVFSVLQPNGPESTDYRRMGQYSSGKATKKVCWLNASWMLLGFRSGTSGRAIQSARSMALTFAVSYFVLKLCVLFRLNFLLLYFKGIVWNLVRMGNVSWPLLGSQRMLCRLLLSFNSESCHQEASVLWICSGRFGISEKAN